MSKVEGRKRTRSCVPAFTVQRRCHLSFTIALLLCTGWYTGKPNPNDEDGGGGGTGRAMTADEMLARLEREMPQTDDVADVTAWALTRAAEGGHVAVVDCLLREQRADPNGRVSRTNHGNSPLMAACAAGEHTEACVRALLEAGAVVNLTNAAQVNAYPPCQWIQSHRLLFRADKC
jgi:hypothetical protein